MGYSFYGGKEGRTYHLVARFDSIQKMVAAFQQGGGYTGASYHEYVIIDTPNKASRENGIIYRRGLNYQQNFALNNNKTTLTREDTEKKTLYGEEGVFYQSGGGGVAPPAAGSLSLLANVPKFYEYKYKLIAGTPVKIEIEYISRKVDADGEDLFEQEFFNFCKSPGGGAEYVGRIVGPDGRAPHLSLQDWTTFVSTYQNSTDGLKTEAKAKRTLGKIDNTKYNDTIKYGFCNVLDEVTGDVKQTYIGFDFPITVFEYSARTVKPYGAVIKEVTSLPSVGEEGVYYKFNSEHYLWDTSRQVVDTASSTSDSIVWRVEPGFVKATPWEATHSADSPYWNYRGLVREKAESLEHPFYKSYDLQIPNGIHGQDVCEVSTHIVAADGQRIDPTTDFLQTVARDSNGNISHTDDKNFSIYYKTKNYNNLETGEISEEKHVGWLRVVDRITDNTNPSPELNELERSHPYVLNDRVGARGAGLSEGLGLLCIVAGQTAAAPVDCSTFAVGYEFTDGSAQWRVIEIKTTPANLLTVHYTYGADNQISIRMLDNLSLSKDGRLFAKYTDLSSSVYLGEVNSIKEVFFDNENGVQSFIIKYNTKKRDASGLVVIDNDRSRIQLENGIAKRDTKGYVIGYPTTDENGYILEQIPQHVKFVSNIQKNEDTQVITLTYNDGTSINFGPYYAVTGVKLNNNLEMEFTWNYKDSGGDYHKSTLNSVLTNEPFKFKTINKLWVDGDGDLDTDQFLKANYNVGEKNSDGSPATGNIGDETKVSEYPINKIEAIRMNGDNLCVLYSSKSKRDALLDDPAKYFMLPYTNPKTQQTKNYAWHNLGATLSSNHILGFFSSLADVKLKYPYGIGKTAGGQVDEATKNRSGWLAVVRQQNGDLVTTETYAYDYEGLNNGLYTADPALAWQKVDSLSSSENANNFLATCAANKTDYKATDAQPVAENGNDPSKIKPNGIWFVKVETEGIFI